MEKFARGLIIVVGILWVLYSMFVSLFWGIATAGIYWYLCSWFNLLAANEVGMVDFWGEICGKKDKDGKEMPYKPGWFIFVPWLPGVRLVRYPKSPIEFTYNVLPADKVWSKDRQELLADIGGWVRFPYEEADSLRKMTQAKVPTDHEGFTAWAKKEIVSGMRDILAGFTLDEAIARSNLEKIRGDAKDFFLRTDGLFAMSGICGNDPQSFLPGGGEVIIRIETIDMTETLRRKKEEVATADLDKQIAKARAVAEGIVAGDPIRLAMEEWVNGQKEAGESHADAHKRLMASGAYGKHELVVKDMLLAKGGNLQVVRNEIGSPDGSGLPPSLQFLSIGGGGGGPGVFVGGKGGQQQGGRRQKGQGSSFVPVTTQEEADADFEQFKKDAQARRDAKGKKD